MSQYIHYHIITSYTLSLLVLYIDSISIKLKKQNYPQYAPVGALSSDFLCPADIRQSFLELSLITGTTSWARLISPFPLPSQHTHIRTSVSIDLCIMHTHVPKSRSLHGDLQSQCNTSEFVFCSLLYLKLPFPKVRVMSPSILIHLLSGWIPLYRSHPSCTTVAHPHMLCWTIPWPWRPYTTRVRILEPVTLLPHPTPRDIVLTTLGSVPNAACSYVWMPCSLCLGSDSSSMGCPYTRTPALLCGTEWL